MGQGASRPLFLGEEAALPVVAAVGVAEAVAGRDAGVAVVALAAGDEVVGVQRGGAQGQLAVEFLAVGGEVGEVAHRASPRIA